MGREFKKTGFPELPLPFIARLTAESNENGKPAEKPAAKKPLKPAPKNQPALPVKPESPKQPVNVAVDVAAAAASAGRSSEGREPAAVRPEAPTRTRPAQTRAASVSADAGLRRVHGRDAAGFTPDQLGKAVKEANNTMPGEKAGDRMPPKAYQAMCRLGEGGRIRQWRPIRRPIDQRHRRRRRQS